MFRFLRSSCVKKINVKLLSDAPGRRVRIQQSTQNEAVKQEDPRQIKALGYFVAFTAVSLSVVAYFIALEGADSTSFSGGKVFWDAILTNERVAPTIEKMQTNFDSRKDGLEVENKEVEGNENKK